MSTKHITAYYLDAKDGRPASEAPTRHGPVLPSENLTVDAVDRRVSPPIIVGTLPASETLSPGMELIDQGAHAARLDAISQWRESNAARQLQSKRAGMVVSRFQARAVLRQMGVREQVEQIIADPETAPLVIDAWADATEFRRESATVEFMAEKIGLTAAEVDDMFEQAAEIKA